MSMAGEQAGGGEAAGRGGAGRGGAERGGAGRGGAGRGGAGAGRSCIITRPALRCLCCMYVSTVGPHGCLDT